MTRCLLFATAVLGCSQPPDYTGDYVPVLAVAVGVAESQPIGSGPAPEPTPRPGVPSPGDCPDLCDSGRLGDGRIVFDCPTCDRDGDGDPNDATQQPPAQEPAALESPEADTVEAETGSRADGTELPSVASLDSPSVVDWRSDYRTALAESNERGVPLAVFVLRAVPPCPPCIQLKRGALTDPDIVELLNRETVPVLVDSRDKPPIAVSRVPQLWVKRPSGGGRVEVPQQDATALGDQLRNLIDWANQ